MTHHRALPQIFNGHGSFSFLICLLSVRATSPITTARQKPGPRRPQPDEWRVGLRCRLPFPPTLLKAGEIAYWTAGAVEALALLAKRLAPSPLPHVLWVHAVAGLAVGIVVVDLRVGRVPRSFALQGPGGLPHRVLNPFNDTLVPVLAHLSPPCAVCCLHKVRHREAQ